MSYNNINWKNYPDQSTPINAENLNAMDTAIKSLDTKATKVEQDIKKIAESSSSDTVALATRGGNFGTIRFGITPSGEYGYFKAGADTVTPFKKDQAIEVTFTVDRKCSCLGGYAGYDQRTNKNDSTAITLRISGTSISMSPSSIKPIDIAAVSASDGYGRAWNETSIKNLAVRII